MNYKEKRQLCYFTKPLLELECPLICAMIKLGGSCITIPVNFLLQQNETLEDTIRVISNYADFIILRHYEDTIDEVTKVSDIPISTQA